MGEVADAAGSEDEAPFDITIIRPGGDLVLHVCDDRSGKRFSFRVSVDQLSRSSAYFERLLDSTKFGEGANISAVLERLKQDYRTVGDAPLEELPSVTISDVGKISKVNSIEPLFADFLRALHGVELSTISPPIANLANLTIVADRFDALPHFSKYVLKRNYVQGIDGKSRARSGSQSEERARQKLLVGVLLDYPPWIAPCSKQLIIQGSNCWEQNTTPDADEALWWDLPHGLEEELIFRREHALEAIESLQTHFLSLYSSGERQCKLGYDSSLQCDSFQLGEMVRFYTRAGLIRWDGPLRGSEARFPYSGDIERLLDILRQCPSYQIDHNHTHCGLRTRLIPIMDSIEPFLRLSGPASEIGICGACWRENRLQYAWAKAKGPVVWSRRLQHTVWGRGRPAAGGEACLASHIKIRDMFMASSRNWTDQDTDDGGGFASKITLGYRKI